MKKLGCLIGAGLLCLATAQAVVLIDYSDGVAGGGHDVAILDGDFTIATTAVPAPWVAIGPGTEQFASNLGSGVGSDNNSVVGWDPVSYGGERSLAIDTGHTIAAGESYNASFMWRDAFGWDADDEVLLILYYTDNNLVTGVQTDLVTFSSGPRATAATWETETATGLAFSDAGAIGKKLFARLDTPGATANEYSRVDNVFLELSSVPSATISSFTVSPGNFNEGDTVTLSWEVADAESVTIDQGVGSVASTGSVQIVPIDTTTWTLSASNGSTVVYGQATGTMDKGPIDVYLLGGQSNMRGIALADNLPSDLLDIPEILYYQAGSGLTTLQPAAGGADGPLFGPEIGFGERLRNLQPGQPIALIKYAVDGTALETQWKPGSDSSDTANWGPQFSGFVTTVNNGLASLTADGWQPVIKGMLWQQGEKDAKNGVGILYPAGETDHAAADYAANLTYFIQRIREQFAVDASPAGIRFVAGQVLPYIGDGGEVLISHTGRDQVRQAVLDLDENSGTALAVTNMAGVPTNDADHLTNEQVIDGYRDTDEIHLTDTAQLALGRSMAERMMSLSPVTYAQWESDLGLLEGPDGDDDDDGLTNSLEFYAGSNPLSDTDSPLLSGSAEMIGGLEYFTVSHPRNLNALGYQEMILEVSEDLASWSNYTAIAFMESAINGTHATVKFRSPWPLIDDAHPTVFFRVIIQENQKD